MAGARPSGFGAHLRRYREAAGLSQEDLAERAGLAAKAIGALERGERRRPYPRTVQVLADALALDDAQRRQLIASISRAPMLGVTDGEVFVGRERELAELVAKLRAAAGGRGGMVMLLGEAGIGKTRLAHQFMEVARGHGAAVLSGRALEGEAQVSYGPWVEAIERYALALRSDELCQVLGSDAPYIAQLVPSVRSRLAEIERPQALAPSDERLRLYNSVSRFLGALAPGGPVVVFLDDLHWADRDTLALLRYVARTLSASAVLLVGAYRDPELRLDAAHPLMTTLASVRHETACPTIRLRGLDQREMGTYLRHAAGRPLTAAFIDDVARETSGNPFYAREVLRHVAEADVHRGGGDTALELAGVPEGVRQVVADRVRRLSPATAQALHAACGFTGGFTYTVLQQLTHLSEDELLDSLDEATEAGLLRAPSADAREYEFAHAIVRHALYHGQSRDRRIRLHRRIASALEAAYPGGELEHAAELAVQYHASAELAGAGQGLRYALAAADQARSAFAHDRVVTLLRMARDLAVEAAVDVQIEILTRLALAEAQTVRSTQARATAERALELMAPCVTERVRAEFVASVARALKHSGADVQLWGPLVDRGLELIRGERDALWAQLTLLRDRFEIARSGPVGVALWSGRDKDAVALARASADESDDANTLEALEWRTRAETDAAYARIQSWSRPLAVLHGLEVVVRDLVYKHGDFPEARRVAEELLALALRTGSVSAEAEARAQIAMCTLNLGDLAAARVKMTQAEQAVERLGPSHRLHLIPIAFAVAMGYFLEADWAALARTAETFARADETHRTTVGLGAAAYAAVALVRAERIADARAWLREIAAVSGRAHATAYLQSWALTTAAAAVWEAGFVELARAYQPLLSHLARLGLGPSAFGSVDLALARMTALAGAAEDAGGSFARAARQADSPGHRPLRGIIAYDEALADARSRRRSERTHSLLDHALGIFDALEMHGWTQRARSLRTAAA